MKTKNPQRMGKMKKKDSELFRPLVATAEKYLRDYCDGKQVDDEKARMFLKVLSLYRKILKVEKRERSDKIGMEETDRGCGGVEKNNIG